MNCSKTKFNFSPNSFRFLRWAIFAALLMIAGAPVLARKPIINPPPFSREQRLAIFDDVWQTIRVRYYDSNLRGVNWEAERETYRVIAANAVSQTEFYLVLKQMVGKLGDSHTRVFAPEEKSDWRSPRAVSVGASVREIENELIFTRVEKNSAAERAGIRVGDLLTDVDDVPAAEFFARRLKEQPGASTAAIRRLRAAANIFAGAADSAVRVGFRAADKPETKIAVLEREWQTFPASINARRENSVLIITFDAFSPEIVRDFFQILSAHTRGMRGIVLDLRGNRGGSAEAMTDISSAFLPAQTVIGNFTDRAGKIEVSAATRRWLLYSASAAKVPDVPVVILTSTATASAAEIFAASLKNANRARIIGTNTCGCVLAVKGQHELSDGGILEISELDFQTPDGARLEGTGVAPDETIFPVRRDLIARRDRTIERAVELVKLKN